MPPLHCWLLPPPGHFLSVVSLQSRSRTEICTCWAAGELPSDTMDVMQTESAEHRQASGGKKKEVPVQAGEGNVDKEGGEKNISHLVPSVLHRSRPLSLVGRTKRDDCVHLISSCRRCIFIYPIGRTPVSSSRECRSLYQYCALFSRS